MGGIAAAVDTARYLFMSSEGFGGTEIDLWETHNPKKGKKGHRHTVATEVVERGSR